MAKTTKPYWSEWQGTTRGEDGWAATEEPDTTRRRVEVGGNGEVDSDARRTVIDQAPPVMDEHESDDARARRQMPRFVESTTPHRHRDYAHVELVDDGDDDDAGRAAGAKHTTAMVLSSRSRGVHLPAAPYDPPHIVVARHELSEELRGDPRLILINEPDSPRSAAYRVLRHQVSQKGNPKVIVVSSAARGEGKTTCAVNLALALGECDRARVLLVEGNLRHPRLGAIFRFEPPWCFAQQLVEHRARPLERWSVVEVAPFGLHVMAVDPRSEQRPLLDAPAFGLAMERLRQAGYDYIVVDAPAVLGTAEVNLIQDAADGVLLVTRSRQSRGRDLRKAVEQLSPGHILGVTLLDQ